ncbi:hypothetical protein J6590_075201 [Homalodisca vitripennis]|nr:hypothetical protein J6590_075201 [Homalodisca vitripennis]
MVDAVHRLAPNIKNPNAPRGIIVKLCRRIDMEEMRRKAIQKRGFSASNLGLSSEKTVYVNLVMSRETRILWAAVRRFKENNRYKFAWITSSGKIHLRTKRISYAFNPPRNNTNLPSDKHSLQLSRFYHPEDDIVNNPLSFWSNLRKLRLNDSCVSSMTLDEAEVEGSEEKTKAFAAYFKSVYDSPTLTLDQLINARFT